MLLIVGVWFQVDFQKLDEGVGMIDPLATFELYRDAGGFEGRLCEVGPCRVCVVPLPDAECTPLCEYADVIAVTVDSPVDIEMPSTLIVPHQVTRVEGTCHWVGLFELLSPATRNSMTVTHVRYTFTADETDAQMFLIEMLTADGITASFAGYDELGEGGECDLESFVANESGDTDWGDAFLNDEPGD